MSSICRERKAEMAHEDADVAAIGPHMTMPAAASAHAARRRPWRQRRRLKEAKQPSGGALPSERRSIARRHARTRAGDAVNDN